MDRAAADHRKTRISWRASTGGIRLQAMAPNPSYDSDLALWADDQARALRNAARASMCRSTGRTSPRRSKAWASRKGATWRAGSAPSLST